MDHSIQSWELSLEADQESGSRPIILFLKVRDDRVTAAKYHTHGCGPTIAAGSMLTELIVGRTLAECGALTADDLIAALDGVPPDKLHCPALAIAALRDALRGDRHEDAGRPGREGHGYS